MTTKQFTHRPLSISMALLLTLLISAALGSAARAADQVYWTNFNNNTISFANLDGTGGGGQLNITGATPNVPRGVAIDPAAGRIYWANASLATISFAKIGRAHV